MKPVVRHPLDCTFVVNSAHYERVIDLPRPLPLGDLLMIEKRIWRVVRMDGVRATIRLEPTVDILH